MDNTFEFTDINDPVPDLMGDLSDALEILYSCRRLAVPVSDQFLDYIDTLIDSIEANRPYAVPSACA
jgi:hypothetical protein